MGSVAENAHRSWDAEPNASAPLPRHQSGSLPDRPLGQNHSDGLYSSAFSGRCKSLGEACCGIDGIDSHIDRTPLIEVLSIPAAQGFFERRIMNKLRRSSARILASRKDCYAQKNRSPQ